MSPQRIQLRRTKGWRKPEGAIVVARPSRWGNPYWHVQKFHGLGLAIALYGNTARGVWSPSLLPTTWPDGYVSQVYEAHAAWLKRLGRHPVEAARAELAGHDLCCWCALDRPCHADILLELANEAGS